MSRPGKKCDCLNECGDDPAVHDGRANPCAHLKRARARRLPGAMGVGRVADNAQAIMVVFKEQLTDSQLEALHDKLRHGEIR